MNLKKNPNGKEKTENWPFYGQTIGIHMEILLVIACCILDQTTNSETTNLEFYLFLSQFFDKINNNKYANNICITCSNWSNDS